MICLPASEPIARAALLTSASPADWRREFPPPNTLPSRSPKMDPLDAGAEPGLGDEDGPDEAEGGDVSTEGSRRPLRTS